MIYVKLIDGETYELGWAKDLEDARARIRNFDPLVEALPESRRGALFTRANPIGQPDEMVLIPWHAIVLIGSTR
jgi:hypothetical protein